MATSKTTPFQPVLPPEVEPSDAEFDFADLSPGGLFPQNQNSNFGLFRKIWTDRIQELANQQSTMYNEKFPATSTQFLDNHEQQYGLPVASPGLTIGQRRQNILNRIRVGPFTRSRRNALIESFISVTFGAAIQFSPAGVALVPAGLPLYSGIFSGVGSLYSVVEDVPGFHFTILIRNEVAPDLVGLHRELDRIVPAHLSYSVVFTSGAIIAPSGVVSITTVSGRVARKTGIRGGVISAITSVSGNLGGGTHLLPSSAIRPSTTLRPS